MRANFQEKQTTLIFSTQIFPKMIFGVGISQIQFWIRNLNFQDTMCVNFLLKRTTYFFGPNLPKKEIRIWNLEN